MYCEDVITNNRPIWRLLDQDNELHKSTDYIGNKLLISFMYKSNNHFFLSHAAMLNDFFNILSQNGYTILCVLNESTTKLRTIFDNYQMNFNFLSDTNNEMAKAFNIWKEKEFAGKKFFGVYKTLFILDEKGKILDHYCIDKDINNQKTWINNLINT